MRTRLAIAVFLVMALAAPRAHADPASESAELKRAGDALMDAKRYDDAIANYDDALKKSPNAAVHYNRGRALQFLGRYPEALASLERFKSEAADDLRVQVRDLDGIIEEVRAKVARLAITCKVAGARVAVRDKLVGTTPLGEVALNAGKATIEVTAEGFTPFRAEVDLPGGGALALEAQLIPKNVGAVIIVKSDVARASVSVDGRVVGNAPAEAVVEAGSHKIRVFREGYSDTETSVVVAAGDRKMLTLDPDKPTPITARWWFWTGIGVVVVGGVVIAAALLTERQGASGDFPPGRTTAPLVKF